MKKFEVSLFFGTTLITFFETKLILREGQVCIFQEFGSWKNIIFVQCLEEQKGTS